MQRNREGKCDFLALVGGRRVPYRHRWYQSGVSQNEEIYVRRACFGAPPERRSLWSRKRQSSAAGSRTGHHKGLVFDSPIEGSRENSRARSESSSRVRFGSST